MARPVHRLNANDVLRAKPGYHADGGGLYLRVGDDGAKSWLFRYRTLEPTTKSGTKLWEMGLGSARIVTLAKARSEAGKLRDAVQDWRNGFAPEHPLQTRRALKSARKAEALKSLTFDQCAHRYVAAHEAEWTNAKHRAQWQTTLERYASPVFGRMLVRDVNVAAVMGALEPIWNEKHATASKLRQRIEAVLDWAIAAELRTGPNPAKWEGRLKHLLADLAIRREAQPHHAAMPYSEIGAFMSKLREQHGMDARALEFTILTAARTSEVLGARWSEIDLAARVWTVPPERMKTGRDKREHRVPLSDAAMAILTALPKDTEFVFPGSRPGRPLGNSALFKLMRTLGRDETVHGFRSTFRDWAAERTSYPAEVAEAALAHSVGSAVVRAYQRSDLFERRRRLMDEWARWCSEPAPTGEVVPLRG